MIRLFTLISLVLLLAACTPTAERLKAARVIDERTHHYSEQVGDVYRYPPHDYAWEESPRAMPDFAALSYSPLRKDPVMVEKPKGRMAPARSRTSPQFGSGWVYSPFTGEAVKLQNGKPLLQIAQ